MKDKRYDDYKKMAITAARELQYGERVINSIKNASSDDEINVIMYLARTSSKEQGCML